MSNDRSRDYLTYHKYLQCLYEKNSVVLGVHCYLIRVTEREGVCIFGYFALLLIYDTGVQIATHNVSSPPTIENAIGTTWYQENSVHMHTLASFYRDCKDAPQRHACGNSKTSSPPTIENATTRKR